MKAKKVHQSLNEFERGMDPKRALGISIEEKNRQLLEDFQKDLLREYTGEVHYFYYKMVSPIKATIDTKIYTSINQGFWATIEGDITFGDNIEVELLITESKVAGFHDEYIDDVDDEEGEKIDEHHIFKTFSSLEKLKIFIGEIEKFLDNL